MAEGPGCGGNQLLFTGRPAWPVGLPGGREEPVTVIAPGRVAAPRPGVLHAGPPPARLPSGGAGSLGSAQGCWPSAAQKRRRKWGQTGPPGAAGGSFCLAPGGVGTVLFPPGPFTPQAEAAAVQGRATRPSLASQALGKSHFSDPPPEQFLDI